ncbi:hypothetical protein Peur_036768 [Populus x canadensis]
MIWPWKCPSLGLAVVSQSKPEPMYRGKTANGEDWDDLWSGGMICGSVCDVSGGARRLELMETVSSIFGGKLNILQWQVKGFKVTGSVCNVTSKSERKKPMSTVPSLFDWELNIHVNNVGMLYFKKNTDFPSEGISLFLTTNLESAYHLHPLLKHCGRGTSFLCLLFLGWYQ